MRLLSDRRGVEVLEAAITTPIAVLLMLAITNLGLVAFAQQAVQAAARHGARLGSVAQVCPACYALAGARDAARGAGIIGDVQVAVLAPGGRPGSLLRIEVTGQVANFLAPMGGLFPGIPAGPFPVRGEASFRQEGW